MTDKEAIQILLNLLKKYPFDEKEQEAVKSAIGILGWTKMLESKIEARKKKRERSAE